MADVFDVLIVGGGAAGYTAGLFAARDRCRALLIEKFTAGGQVLNCEHITNFPGFPQGVAGYTLGPALQEQATAAGLQVAMVRWFRNTLNDAMLEFGCELLSENPEAAAAAPENGPESSLLPVLVLPEEADADPGAPPPQLAAPAGAFELEQAVSLRRGSATGFAVLTKLVEQGPGFDLYEFVPVS